RSDKWAKENLVGKQMEIKNWKQGTDQMPETENQTPVYITNYEALFNDLRPISDHYDIDGDGDTSYMIRAVKPGSVLWNRPAYQQQITKQSTTNIRTYLIDSKTGDEIQDAELYPHQTVEFVQTMELLSAGNGTDFIGYYHIPKRHHKTDYADADGNKQTHTSEFDTYLTSFLTTTVDGTGIPPDAGLRVYYYLSPNPNDPASDDHNAMHELVDGQTDTSPNYKTQLQIEQMAVDQGVELKDILKNCTMIKIRADVIETRKSIVSKATLAIGHKEEGDKKKIHDYFSGQYRYTLDTGARLPASYTSLTTLAMLPYAVGGTVFYDKDANSLASPLESGISGVAVELWQTGTDPHTGIPITDTLVDTQTSDANGRYGFTIAYHGDYFLKFKMSDGKKLSLKNQYGGFVYEQSVFDQVTEGGQDYAKATFSLSDHSLPYQNAGIVDARTLTVPEDIYISVGENAKLNYQITPNYLMDDQFFRITPDIVSDIVNNEFFTVDGLHTLLTGVKEGTGTITVSIPDAPLDGTTYITKTVTVHVEPASVASVSVPAKAEIYAVQGKTNEVIAPELTVHNYSPDPVKAYIKRIDSNNTGAGKDLKLVKKKDSYDRDEISLNVIPVPRTNPFSALAKTDLTQVEYIKGGLPLGTMEGFHENSNWGKFTFDGEYNPVIILTNLEDNRFVMSYRFEKAGTP
ncbi:MAG: SdrD B-like domain-containing protein, partial [Lachnospiraceae bacterium]